MNTFTQEPGQLDLKLVPGDEIALQLNFHEDLSDYELEAGIKVSSSLTLPFDVVAVDIINGIISLIMQEEYTAQISLSGLNKWYFKWTVGGVSRTIIAGGVTVIQ